MNFTLQKLVNIGLLLALIVVFMVLGKVILIPVVFAVIISLALIPVVGFWERKGLSRLFSVILTFLGMAMIFSIIIGIFVLIFSNIYQDLAGVPEKIDAGIQALYDKVKKITGMPSKVIEDNITSNGGTIIGTSWSFLKNTVILSAHTIGNFFLILIFTFFVLLYRKGIKSVLLGNIESETKEKKKELLTKIQKVIQGYISGLAFVILILGVLNSLGLWIIGIDFAIFWGFLGGLLAVIPYLGTTLGGTLPFLYALATTNTTWQPIAVVAIFFTIQQIEGQFITPKTIGSKINVNMPTVIIGMITGGLIWGISGIILAIPAVGIMQLLLSHFEETAPIGQLMGRGISK